MLKKDWARSALKAIIIITKVKESCPSILNFKKKLYNPRSSF